MGVHFEGAFGSEVGLHDVLEAHGGVDVHGEGLDFLENFGLGVEILDVGHRY